MSSVQAASSENLIQQGPVLGPWSLFKIWLKHLSSFIWPLVTLAFLVTAPHSWYIPILVVGFGFFSIWVDMNSQPDRQEPPANLPQGIFTFSLYLLAFINLANVFFLIRVPWVSGLFSVDSLGAFLIVGATAGYSGVVVAHELVHRRSKHLRLLSRFILIGVLYDHFYVDHVRGHHVHVGTAEDPATARFNESFWPYFIRTSWGQFASGWDLETKRLQRKYPMGPGWRLYQHQVLQGFVCEILLLVLISVFFGIPSLLIFLLYATFAHLITQAVTYFEHYGLSRKKEDKDLPYSWETDSRFSLFSLIGLSRHTDHHNHAHRPYPSLRPCDKSPRLPYGYYVCVALAVLLNKRFRDILNGELKRLRLGPFAPSG